MTMIWKIFYKAILKTPYRLNCYLHFRRYSLRFTNSYWSISQNFGIVVKFGKSYIHFFHLQALRRIFPKLASGSVYFKLPFFYPNHILLLSGTIEYVQITCDLWPGTFVPKHWISTEDNKSISRCHSYSRKVGKNLYILQSAMSQINTCHPT